METNFQNLKEQLTNYKKTSIGYPMNYGYDYSDINNFINLNINNVGDPFSGSPIKCNTKSIECEVLHFFAKLWNIDENKI
mgnify:CR=1 FL=1